jgi:GNAT superfamily N-acetyltransferase
MSYRIRPATLDDRTILAQHRVRMFKDMNETKNATAIGARFVEWLGAAMPEGTYRAWLVEDARGAVVAGGGITLLPWPPGPRYLGDRIAFVYNVYTEPEHRRRGLARKIMEAIHGWCREHDVGLLALNASASGRPLYESMGSRASSSPMMVLVL